MNVLTGLLAALALTTSVAGYKVYQVRSLKQEIAVIEFQLDACGVRLKNIVADMESDNEVDNLPDAALRDIPDHWLHVPDSDSDSE